VPTYPFTQKQGQYLAFIYYYSKINGQPPAEADMQRYFRVSPPSVHQMVITLEAKVSFSGFRGREDPFDSCSNARIFRTSNSGKALRLLRVTAAVAIGRRAWSIDFPFRCLTSTSLNCRV
jgi:hypothetical protein